VEGLLYLKMDIGFILIVSILVLGGVIATVGDRIGTRVGKARLSLFKLRPRRTAVLVTIVTGIVISGSTLAILLATSKSLRTGLFQVDEIQKQLRKAHGELERTLAQKQQTEAQKNQTERELATTIGQKNQTEKELAKTAAQKQQTEKELAKTTAQKQQTEKELAITTAQKEQELATITAQKQQTESELAKNVAQQAQIKSELTKTKTEKVDAQKRLNITREREQQLRLEIARRETLLSKLEQQLQEREQQLQSQNQQLQEREKQLTFLQQELTTLEQYYQDYQALRQGNVALLRGQVLASRVLRIVDPGAARQAVDQLLSEAHRTAIGATHPTHSKADEPVVQITPAQVAQLIGQIKDGRDYVVRILSAGNYVVGEKQIRVFADAALNQVVFYSGDVLATTSTDPSKMSEEEIRQQLEQLIAASEFRARRAGLIGDEIQIGDGRITTLIGFIEQMKQYDKPVDLKVVVEEDAYTAGPLKMNLVAVKDGKVIYST
jgi:uncharacterized protein (DUF3084 family)